MIYLDNAATSFPKPASCFQDAMDAFLAAGASPGRGGYDAAVSAEREVEAVRRAMATYVGAPDFVTCFAYNATDALNTLLQGLVEPGDHVISTRLEHNSVLRPLHHLAQAGIISFDLAPCNEHGVVEPGAVEALFQPGTRLVMLNHASNVLGTLQPAVQIGALCRERGVPLVLDASQSAGAAPIDMLDWQVSALAFTGHKSLLGPPGIGGMVIDPALEVRPTRWGGTGVNSESVLHSRDYPERLEAGTINLLGVMTLGRCLELLAEPQAAEALQGEAGLHARLVEGMVGLEGVTVHCPGHGPGRIPVVSFNLEGWAPYDVGMVLDGDYEIAVRTGLHCAPLLHQDLGNGPAGSVRVSLGRYNTREDVEALLAALAEMLGQS